MTDPCQEDKARSETLVRKLRLGVTDPCQGDKARSETLVRKDKARSDRPLSER